MKRQALAALALGAGLAFATPGFAQKPVTVGGAPMFANNTTVENAVNSKDHTTLVAAVKAAGLADTLSSPGPCTVFAPTDRAFAKLPDGTVQSLVQPAQKAKLTSILTYHVVPGRLTARDLTAAVRKGGGEAELKTVQGETLTVMRAGKGLTITDAKGGKSWVTIADVRQSNGVIHVVDSVLMP